MTTVDRLIISAIMLSGIYFLVFLLPGSGYDECMANGHSHDTCAYSTR